MVSTVRSPIKTEITRRKNVVCNQTILDRSQLKRLELIANVVVAEGDLLLRALETADAAIIIRPTKVTREMLQSAQNLKVIATVSAGSDHIDLEAVRDRGIKLVTGTGAAPSAVAEWVVWAILSQRRNFLKMVHFTEDGLSNWSSRLEDHQSLESTRINLGLVGFGRSGRAVYLALKPYAMQIFVYDSIRQDLPADCTFIDDLKILCKLSDVVTVHVPLDKSTVGLIGEDELRSLGSSGLLINSARGDVVNQDALVMMLETGELGAAAIDCFDPEPYDELFRSRLVATGRALLTPHVAGYSAQGIEALCRQAVDGIAKVLGLEVDQENAAGK